MNGHARVQAGRSHLVRAERAACASDMKVKSNSWQHGALVLASGGVTGAAGAAAAWGALFTAQTRCSRRREAGSIFFVSNFFKEQFGVSLRSGKAAVEWRRSNALPRACPAARPSSAS